MVHCLSGKKKYLLGYDINAPLHRFIKFSKLHRHKIELTVIWIYWRKNIFMTILSSFRIFIFIFCSIVCLLCFLMPVNDSFDFLLYFCTARNFSRYQFSRSQSICCCCCCNIYQKGARGLPIENDFNKTRYIGKNMYFYLFENIEKYQNNWQDFFVVAVLQNRICNRQCTLAWLTFSRQLNNFLFTAWRSKKKYYYAHTDTYSKQDAL